MERDFSNSYVVYNASSLAFSYPFVSVNPLNSVIRSMFHLIDRTPVYRLLWSLSLFYLSFSLSLFRFIDSCPTRLLLLRGPSKSDDVSVSVELVRNACAARVAGSDNCAQCRLLQSAATAAGQALEPGHPQLPYTIICVERPATVATFTTQLHQEGDVGHASSLVCTVPQPVFDE